MGDEAQTSDGGVDTGTLLEVPESAQKDYDDFLEEEVNEDEFVDYSDVPDGDVVELSTANLDEED
jgi:hypothetical protein